MSGTAFAACFLWALGSTISLPYLGLCGALSLLAACLVAAFASIGRAPAGLALALWAGLQGWLFIGPLAGVVLAGIALAVLEGAGRRLHRADTWGLWTTASIALGLFFWPRASFRFGLSDQRPEVGAGDWLSLVVIVSALLALAGWEILRKRSRYLPSATVVAVSLLTLCVVVTLAASGAARGRRVPDLSRPEVETSLPDIMLLVLDTVRADHLSLYGYERKTTPELERFVRRYDNTVVYPLAHSNATWTLPAHASLLTGVLPSEHGVQAQTAFRDGTIVSVPLKAERTLAESLRDAGYRTACVYANSWLQHVKGLERGFDWYFRPLGTRALPVVGERIREWLFPAHFVKEGRSLPQAEVINSGVLRFLDNCKPGPCFIVANYMEAHAPYIASLPYLGAFGEDLDLAWQGPPEVGDSPEVLRRIESRYDEEILGLDFALGRLFEELAARGRLDTMWLVITSDHGEAFGEHGEMEHGSTVYGETTRVPLIVKPPRGVRLPAHGDAVDLLDVAATLSAIASGKPLGRGRDLRSSPLPQKAVAIELFPDPRNLRDEPGALEGHPARAAIQGSLKLIEHVGRRELYDLRVDVNERRDVAALYPAEVERIALGLPPLRETHHESGSLKRLSPEQEAELRALGYMK